MTRIEPRCAKSYPSALVARVLPLAERENQPHKNSFGTLEDLSQDLKIVSVRTLSGPFGTLRHFFLGHYWTFYCRPTREFLHYLGKELPRENAANCELTLPMERQIIISGIHSIHSIGLGLRFFYLMNFFTQSNPPRAAVAGFPAAI